MILREFLRERLSSGSIFPQRNPNKVRTVLLKSVNFHPDNQPAIKNILCLIVKVKLEGPSVGRH